MLQIGYSASKDAYHDDRDFDSFKSKLNMRWRMARSLIKDKANPFALMSEFLSDFMSASNLLIPPDFNQYQDVISKCKVIACVIEHPSYLQVIEINHKFGIPTIICPHNLETFDATLLDMREDWSQFAFISNFVNQLRILDRCDARLFISKLEADWLAVWVTICNIIRICRWEKF